MKANPYQSPSSAANAVAAKPVAPLFTKAALMFAYHLIPITLIALALIFVVPRFDKIFAEFETTLPSSTLLILTLSRGAIHYWFLFPLVMGSYLLFLVGLQKVDQKTSGAEVLWSLLFWFGSFAFFVLLITSLSSPLLGINYQLSK